MVPIHALLAPGNGQMAHMLVDGAFCYLVQIGRFVLILELIQMVQLIKKEYSHAKPVLFGMKKLSHLDAFLEVLLAHIMLREFLVVLQLLAYAQLYQELFYKMLVRTVILLKAFYIYPVGGFVFIAHLFLELRRIQPLLHQALVHAQVVIGILLQLVAIQKLPALQDYSIIQLPKNVTYVTPFIQSWSEENVLHANQMQTLMDLRQAQLLVHAKLLLLGMVPHAHHQAAVLLQAFSLMEFASSVQQQMEVLANQMEHLNVDVVMDLHGNQLQLEEVVFVIVQLVQYYQMEHVSLVQIMPIQLEQ